MLKGYSGYTFPFHEFWVWISPNYFKYPKNSICNFPINTTSDYYIDNIPSLSKHNKVSLSLPFNHWSLTSIHIKTKTSSYGSPSTSSEPSSYHPSLHFLYLVTFSEGSTIQCAQLWGQPWWKNWLNQGLCGCLVTGMRLHTASHYLCS